MQTYRPPSGSTRRLFRKQDAVILFIVLAACAGFFLFHARHTADSSAVTAKIYLNSEEIDSIVLHKTDNYRISLMEEYGIPVTLEVTGGAIHFVDVDCPDHICEKTGLLSTSGQVATCMPNGVTVVIVAGAG